MTTTLEQLRTRTDADTRTARETYRTLLSKSAGGTTLAKLEADKLHTVCQQLSITAEQAAEDEATLRRVAELSAASTGWDKQMQELTAEQKRIGPNFTPTAEAERREKLRMEFVVGHERLNKIDRDHLDIARQRHELQQLQQNSRLFPQDQPH